MEMFVTKHESQVCVPLAVAFKSKLATEFSLNFVISFFVLQEDEYK